MKKVIFWVTAVVFSLAVTIPVDAQQTAVTETAEKVFIPCLDSAFDTEDAVAAWGVGQAFNRSEAYQHAMEDALQVLARRFHINSKSIESMANMWCRQVLQNADGSHTVYVVIHVSKDNIIKTISTISK